MQMLLHELVVCQVRVAGEHAVDLLHLSRAQILVRIEAPAAREQPLPAQHFVNAGDASGEPMGGIEQRGIGVGQLGAERQQPQRLLAVSRTQPCSGHGVAAPQDLDRALRPDGPLAEQAAGKVQTAARCRRGGNGVSRSVTIASSFPV